jgi:branched-chain amino acid transport system permease protein
MKPSFFTSTGFHLLLLAAGIGTMPFLVASGLGTVSLLSELSMVAIAVILAVGLNLLMGYAGQVSLGHAAFYGIGAYTSAILTTQFGWSPWLAMLMGIGLTVAVAFVVGVPCLRLHGHYLAMATLGFNIIVFVVMNAWTPVTQGSSGVYGIPKLSIGAWTIASYQSQYFLTWAAALLVLLVSVNIVNSRVGRALRALHGSEPAAATLGVNIAWYKVQVFVLSAAFASLAGSLYAHIANYISPSAFAFGVSVQLVVMVVIGGMASVWGAVIGATAITFLSLWLDKLSGKVPQAMELKVVAFGLVLVLVMIFMPGGLTVGVRDLVRRWLRRGRAESAAPATREGATTP